LTFLKRAGWHFGFAFFFVVNAIRRALHRCLHGGDTVSGGGFFFFFFFFFSAGFPLVLRMSRVQKSL